MRFPDRARLGPGAGPAREGSGASDAPPSPAPASSCRAPADAPFPCDRCGAGMFRMHSVWRCPSCGFKTDCCGW